MHSLKWQHIFFIYETGLHITIKCSNGCLNTYIHLDYLLQCRGNDMDPSSPSGVSRVQGLPNVDPCLNNFVSLINDKHT